jgi:hypothetical protein
MFARSPALKYPAEFLGDPNRMYADWESNTKIRVGIGEARLRVFVIFCTTERKTSRFSAIRSDISGGSELTNSKFSLVTRIQSRSRTVFPAQATSDVDVAIHNSKEARREQDIPPHTITFEFRYGDRDGAAGSSRPRLRSILTPCTASGTESRMFALRRESAADLAS